MCLWPDYHLHHDTAKHGYSGVAKESTLLSSLMRVVSVGMRVMDIHVYGDDPGGPVVIILVSGSEIRGFDPGRGRWIISESKNPEYDFLWKGSKAVGTVW